MSDGVRCCLVLGGARSGKSSYAETLAETWATKPWYVATAEAGDREMQDRIALHRTRRGSHWCLREEPLALPEAVAGLPKGDTALVDCLTVWLGNLMARGLDPQSAHAALLEAVAGCRAHLILVANEVGLAKLPENAMAREFASHAGKMNRSLACQADQVVLLLAGVPVRLKSDSVLPTNPVHPAH